MMRSALLISAVLYISDNAVVAATMGVSGDSSLRHSEVIRYKESSSQQHHRDLEGSGDGISFDDDFWAYDADKSMDVAWTDYSLKPVKCMIFKNKHVIAFELFGKGHNQCAKKKQGTYTMDVGQFARAYVAQQQINYKLANNGNYGNPGSLAYLECTQVDYNDATYYAKLGCSAQNGLKLLAFSDESCSVSSNVNIGLYNDIKISFNTCQACVTYPAEDAEVDVDDQFDTYHMYDSKLCSAAAQYKDDCGWGCKRAMGKNSSTSGQNAQRSWNGFEKFCLFFWSFATVASIWVVLKQRRTMTREDAIVEEAAMNGVGLKKRHVFPLALGIIFFILLAMFMVWKRMTWILLIGTNVGLFAHFVYLRRKAKKSGQGGEGYVKDAGLEIS